MRAGAGWRYVAPVTNRLYVVAALLLTATGELEAVLGSATDPERIVSMIAVPAIALPLVWARRAPRAVLATVALALLAQAALGGFLVGSAVTTLAVLALALYGAGRQVTGLGQFAWAAGLGALIAATRVAFDPAAQSPREAGLTFVAVATPLLVGRWAREQSLLRRELADRVARRSRDRERDALYAAEEERARIAVDLQSAVAEGLRSILAETSTVRGQLGAGERPAARATLADIAATARSALADVRRVLGVLRHDGEDAPLAPPPQRPSSATTTAAEVASPAPPDATAQRIGGRGDPHVIDLCVALTVLVLGALELAIVAPSGQRVTAPLTALVVSAPLLWRRRRPFAVALAILAAIALQSTLVDLDSFPAGDIAAMVTATYALGAYAGRRAALAGLVLITVGVVVHAAVFYPDGVVAAALGGSALPWVVGRVVHSNRELAVAGRRKSAEIERRREREARAAVTGERMRVARELHDAVAHNVSVIAIQAGSADAIVQRDPERTAQIVGLIETVTREALAELDRLGGPPEKDAEESPSLGQIDRLASRARSTGLDVDVHVEGPPARLPAGVDLAAFRIVQEALANTARHAHADHAWVTVRYAPRSVEVEIGDHGRVARNARHSVHEGGGHGLVGMRERVALYDGSLDVGPRSGGGYLVRARLPVES